MAKKGGGSEHNGAEHAHDGALPPINWDALTPELYDDLHQIARHCMRGQRNWTLQATGLLNEACVKVFGVERMRTAQRSEILALASFSMRNILVDEARRRGRIKRAPPGQRVSFEEILMEYENRSYDLLALNDALKELATFDPAMAKAVDLCFFAGMPQEEVAEIVGIPVRTFQRRWDGTKAWLKARIA